MNYSFFLTCISLRKVKQPIPSINKVINNHIKVDLHMSVYMHISYKLDSRSSPIVDLKWDFKRLIALKDLWLVEDDTGIVSKILMM
jgi:hypothetical protein